MSFSVRATLPKDRFALDEPVPLEVVAISKAAGPMPAPVIDGQGATIAFELRRDGGAPIVARPARDPSRRPATRPTIATGTPVRGTIDLVDLVGGLAPGRHEVVAILEPAANRSAPVAFTVERATLHAAVAAPAGTSGEDERSVLRLEARGAQARLIATRPEKGHHGTIRRVALDAGAVSAASQIALAVGPPRATDPRTWAVALSKDELARRFLDERSALELAALSVPARSARLVGALTGRLEPSPVLHVALLAAEERGARLLVLDAPNQGAPRWRELALDFVPGACVVSSLDEETRVVFLAGSGEEEPTRLVAVPWTDAALGAPVPLLSVHGALVGMDAAASPERDIVRLVALSKPAEEDLGLALQSATIDARGRVARDAERVFRRDRVPAVDSVRVRAIWESELVLLARELATQRPVVFAPGALELSTAPSVAGAFWDVERVRGGFLHALSVDAESGLVVGPVEAPE